MEKYRKAFASAKEVAELAGVSRSAVSRTFTPGASVSDETRQRVIVAAEKLGYHVNHLARGLLRRSSGIVCLVASDCDAPYMARLIRVLAGHLQQAGKVAMVLDTSGPQSAVEGALRQTLNYRADATVVLSGVPPRSIIRTCLDNGQRLILINRDDRLKGPHNISFDTRKAARIAFERLVAAGCRKLAVVTCEAVTPSLLTRERAFIESAGEAGFEAAVVRHGRATYAAGAAGAEALLGTRERPDGAFCVTDLIACGFMDVARHRYGIRIPEELCVIGFDDIEQAGWSSYNLTTFSPPVDRLAEKVVELAMQHEEGAPGNDRRPRHIPIDVPLVWRDTVRRG